MDQTLLNCVRTLQAEVGIPVVTTTATPNQQTAQIVALINATCDDLVDAADWPVLRKTFDQTFVTTMSSVTIGTTGAYSPGRIICDTGWDVTNRWRFVGSISDQQWNRLVYGGDVPLTQKIFRTRDDNWIDIYPATVAGDRIVLDFIAKQYAWRESDDHNRESLELDTDTHVFRPRLVMAGAKYRFLQAKGLPFASAEGEYRRLLEQALVAAKPARKLSFAGRRGRHLIGYDNVKDGNWP